MRIKRALIKEKKTLKTVIPILFLTTVYACCQNNQHAPTQKQFATKQVNELETYISKLKTAYPIPALSIVVIKDDQVYMQSSGVADAAGKPFTTDIPFSAGSISEPMLATMVMKAVAEGIISLDDPVATYLPYFKMSGKVNQKVTVAHLLTHTSGIQHYNVMWDTPNDSPEALEITTKSIAGQAPKFPVPGSRVSRSPYNYDILADFLSKFARKQFEVYTQEELFKPLQMNASSFKKTNEFVTPFSVTNWLTYKTAEDQLYPYNAENGGSNGLHVSTKDLATWMYMLLNKGKTTESVFVDKKDFQKFFSKSYKTGEHSAVGFGWEISTVNNEQVYTKSSRITNFSTQVTLIPEKNIGVAVFANIGGDFYTEPIVQNLLSWLNNKPLPEPKIPVGMLLGKKLQETGNLDATLQYYNVLKKENKAGYDLSEAALNQFGTNFIVHFRDTQKAVQVFNFSASRYPASALAYLNLAETYMKNKEVGKARQALALAKPFINSSSKAQADYIESYLEEMSRDPDPG